MLSFFLLVSSQVGEEIPSAQHIKSMEQAAEDAGVEADEDWFHDQW
jgi:hypothetical protein